MTAPVEHFPAGDIGVGTYAQTVEFAEQNIPQAFLRGPSACGGCGNRDPEARCIGCLHAFTTGDPR